MAMMYPGGRLKKKETIGLIKQLLSRRGLPETDAAHHTMPFNGGFACFLQQSQAPLSVSRELKDIRINVGSRSCF